MNAKVIFGFLMAGLIPVFVFGWFTSETEPALVKPGLPNQALAGGVDRTLTEQFQPAMMSSKPADAFGAKPLTTPDLLLVPSADTSASMAPAASRSASYETATKQDLYGTITAVESLVAVDRPPDRESAEFAAIMAVKDAAMNALHGKQAAEKTSPPGLGTQTPQASQARKSPT